jgi:hypothetical protein
MFRRETLEDGTVLLKDERCSFSFRELRPGVMLMQVSGYDTGQLGSAPMDELYHYLRRSGPLELFVTLGHDDTTHPNLSVQEAWSEWFNLNRAVLKRVHILALGKYMHFTTEVMKLFSRTGELVHVHADSKPFEEALARAVPGVTRLRPVMLDETASLE